MNLSFDYLTNSGISKPIDQSELADLRATIKAFSVWEDAYHALSESYLSITSPQILATMAATAVNNMISYLKQLKGSKFSQWAFHKQVDVKDSQLFDYRQASFIACSSQAIHRPYDVQPATSPVFDQYSTFKVNGILGCVDRFSFGYESKRIFEYNSSRTARVYGTNEMWNSWISDCFDSDGTFQEYSHHIMFRVWGENYDRSSNTMDLIAGINDLNIHPVHLLSFLATASYEKRDGIDGANPSIFQATYWPYNTYAWLFHSSRLKNSHGDTADLRGYSFTRDSLYNIIRKFSGLTVNLNGNSLDDVDRSLVGINGAYATGMELDWHKPANQMPFLPWMPANGFGTFYLYVRTFLNNALRCYKTNIVDMLTRLLDSIESLNSTIEGLISNYRLSDSERKTAYAMANRKLFLLLDKTPLLDEYLTEYYGSSDVFQDYATDDNSDHDLD